MYTTPTTQASASSIFVPASSTKDTVIDGLPEPLASRPWPFKVRTEAQDDSFPTTSQSWPSVSDFFIGPSLGAVGEELELDSTAEESFCQDSPETSSSLSPAAAFLSSFISPTPASDAAKEDIPGYVLGATIGQGGFSTIKEATSASGGIVAVKIVRHSAFNHLPWAERSRHRSRLSHEARVWQSLSHENILPLFDTQCTGEAMYLITLYCPAGSLLDILKREGTPALEQTDAGCMFRQVVKGLRYLHEDMSLVHGDIKLENVLVDESGVCRLTDFGLARRIGGDSSQVSSTEEEDSEDATPPTGTHDRSRVRRAGTSALPVHLSLMRHGPSRHRSSEPPPVMPPTHPNHTFLSGSLPYAAPELLLPHAHTGEAVHGNGSRPTAHPAQDMWALGVLLYTLLTGMLPFRDAFEPRLQMKILRGTYTTPPGIGPLAESVLKGCLERDIGERWSIAIVDDASWGIGYGNVEIDPVIREEQRSQSQSRTPPRLPPSTCDDLATSMSSCSLISSAPTHTPPSRGRPPRIGVRSQSRSPSPSVAPRTPNDEDEDVATYFGVGRRRRQRDEGDVHIMVKGEDVDWEPHDGAYDEECADSEVEAAGLSRGDEKRGEGIRGRQGAAQNGSRSRTRGRTTDNLTGARVRSRSR